VLASKGRKRPTGHREDIYAREMVVRMGLKGEDQEG